MGPNEKLLLSKENHRKKRKRQPPEWEKVSANKATNK